LTSVPLPVTPEIGPINVTATKVTVPAGLSMKPGKKKLVPPPEERNGPG
jgi:hypothetical protein